MITKHMLANFLDCLNINNKPKTISQSPLKYTHKTGYLKIDGTIGLNHSGSMK